MDNNQPAAPTYSQTRIAHGPLLFISGQVPVGAGGSVAENDITAQTHAVLDRIEALLAEHDLTLANVVRITTFLTRIEDLAGVRQVLSGRLPDPKPASTLAQVTALIDPRFLIEIDAIATLDAPASTE